MAGITNLAFRKIIKKMGCGLVYSEMINDIAVNYENKKTLGMLKINKIERPISVQIFGDDPKTMASAANKIVNQIKPDIIDLNMGCPVRKVTVKKSAGSAILKDLDNLKNILLEVKNSIGDTPLTIKIRSG
jgi:tRNA-dihydrouridine synthase